MGRTTVSTHHYCVCLISLIDIARRGVRAFVCTIVLPESPANYVAVNVVYSLTNTRLLTSEIVLRQQRLNDVRPIPVIINLPDNISITDYNSYPIADKL